MNESKIIKILIGLFLILVVFGGFMVWQQSWFSLLWPSQFTQEGNILTNLSFLSGIAGFNQEKTYLLLFQNNLELRPGGGYLGNFGILKIKNGQIISFEVHDTNIFDGFSKIKTEPPQPIKNYLGIDNWQMRDANWSPDFPTSAKQAEYFYHLQGGQEEFDGVIGVNASVLPDLLELIGPIYLKEFDLNFTKDNALYQLEYEIEKGYVQRNIEAGERKTVFKKLVNEVLEKLKQKNLWQWRQLKDLVIKELEEKNIILYFKDPDIQKEILRLNWTGKINEEFDGDYLMLVEANLGAKKSNFFIKREIEYHIDLNGQKPQAELQIKYYHQGKENDWFNDDYKAFLRIYVPKGSWFIKEEDANNETNFSEEFNKTIFGRWIEIKTGQTKIIKYKYTLPETIKKEKNYKILIQKQAGVHELPFEITLKDAGGQNFKIKKTIKKDWEGIAFLKR